MVVAGRLSPEKNQTRLIEAFDLVLPQDGAAAERLAG